LPTDMAWQNLEWRCDQGGKALPPAAGRHAFAVYGFTIHDKRPGPIPGFLAVVARRQFRQPPGSAALSTSAPEYLTGQIGEGVSVCWTSGNVVCVCLVQGGADSLQRLQQLIEASPA